ISVVGELGAEDVNLRIGLLLRGIPDGLGLHDSEPNRELATSGPYGRSDREAMRATSVRVDGEQDNAGDDRRAGPDRAADGNPVGAGAEEAEPVGEGVARRADVDLR